MVELNAIMIKASFCLVGRSLDHFGTETTGVSEVSLVDENQNVPLKFKERFEELAAEKALILHDNLEQREK